jgi:hypothetical protein
MLLGDRQFIEEAKPWQRRMGGNLFTVLPFFASAQKQFQAYISTFKERQEKLKRVVKLITEATKDSSLLRFNPAEPQMPMVHFVIK